MNSSPAATQPEQGGEPTHVIEDAIESRDAALLAESADVSTSDEVVPGGVITKRSASTPFQVHLDVFSGPFDLLLGLIAKHKLDVTEIALHKVTDEFIAHIRQAQKTQADWDLGQASEFLLIAATLLDLKAARLLPNSGPEDEDDLALIEARDLLFARLLQYRAFKQVASAFDQRMATAGRITARQAGLEEQFAGLLPELVMNVTPEQLAMIAASAMIPKMPPSVGLEHLHQAAVSVREQAEIVANKLRAQPVSSFRDLVADADNTLVIVARFLAVLELFKEAVIVFEQEEALGDLTVRWTADTDTHVEVSAEFDEDDPVPTAEPDPDTTAPDDEGAGDD